MSESLVHLMSQLTLRAESDAAPALRDALTARDVAQWYCDVMAAAARLLPTLELPSDDLVLPAVCLFCGETAGEAACYVELGCIRDDEQGVPVHVHGACCDVVHAGEVLRLVAAHGPGGGAK